ncbi:hypothetical protein [Campylobacter showae]|jgi:hypothetical protein|uniref:hypothetical protein n=1 Tax=Campylobacter showae TaxID=204 RepID=UPI000F0810D5|nr:hypothetical protein [Campylobacter showae]DAU25798.1 MAG TPA: hypothetical protein [Caudoviricetes sp.]
MYNMLKSATEEDLNSLLNNWLKICEGQGDEGAVFAQDIEDKIKGLIKDIQKEEFFAYILSDEEGKECVALLDIIRALPHSDVGWLKIFDMTITPRCTLNGGDYGEIANALQSVFMESLKLLLNEKYKDIKEIKIFARNEITKKLFEDIVNYVELMEELNNNNVVMFFKAKWLTLRKKN